MTPASDPLIIGVGRDNKNVRVVDNRPMSSCSQALFRSILEEKPCLAAALRALQQTF